MCVILKDARMLTEFADILCLAGTNL